MLAQRIMDDIIDLEMEKIDKILEKVASDPETGEVKQTEKHLWEKIRSKTLMGRRTGVGTTAEGDMLAALDLQYGTEKASEFSEFVHKSLALLLTVRRWKWRRREGLLKYMMPSGRRITRLSIA